LGHRKEMVVPERPPTNGTILGNTITDVMGREGYSGDFGGVQDRQDELERGKGSCPIPITRSGGLIAVNQREEMMGKKGGLGKKSEQGKSFEEECTGFSVIAMVGYRIQGKTAKLGTKSQEGFYYNPRGGGKRTGRLPTEI